MVTSKPPVIRQHFQNSWVVALDCMLLPQTPKFKTRNSNQILKFFIETHSTPPSCKIIFNSAKVYVKDYTLPKPFIQDIPVEFKNMSFRYPVFKRRQQNKKNGPPPSRSLESPFLSRVHFQLGPRWWCGTYKQLPSKHILLDFGAFGCNLGDSTSMFLRVSRDILTRKSNPSFPTPAEQQQEPRQMWTLDPLRQSIGGDMNVDN